MKKLLIATLSIFALFLGFTPAAAEGDPVIAAVGDMVCPPGAAVTTSVCRHQQVADLLAGTNVSAFLPLGDEQYNSGALSAFNTAYDKSYGPYKSISHPTPGNHEYGTTDASGYFTYFGSLATPQGKSYYSYNIGSWHLISLNSMCKKVGGCTATSPQTTWLKADLAANPTACTLVYYHHPRWNAGEHGNATNMTATWNVLYDRNVDLVLNGHEHSYQRFKPLNKTGVVDAARGIREIVAGMGGKSHYAGPDTYPTWDFQNDTTYGMLFVTLHPTSYDWQFVSEAGAVIDSGTSNCH